MDAFEEAVERIRILKEAADRTGLRQFLAADDERIQSQAIQALAELRDAEGIMAAFPRLDDFAKAKAIQSLGTIGDRLAAPFLRDLAANAMALDSFTRDALAKALGRLGGDDAIEGLRSLLACGDSLVVSTVVTVLFDMSEPKARELLDQHGQRRW